ncbi:MAG: amino acid carrier protein [Oscillospiraceae bacterium]
MFEIFKVFRDFLWGVPLIVLIVGTGLILTILTKGYQFRHLGLIIKSAFTKDKNAGEEGVIPPLEAVSIAIGAAVGVGNVGGVATAIAVGGPGALFWIWVAALLGMIIKMAEVTLAVYYRETDENGEPYGGPTYYMQNGLGKDLGFKGWKIVAILFGLGFSITAFITLGNYNTSDALATTFNIPILIPSALYAVTVLILTIGGIKKLGKIAKFMVPFMCIFYVGCGLIIIATNITNLPATLQLVFSSAFTGHAAVGGFTGVAFAAMIRTGFARSVYSNEAGWGTSPMIHASARTSHPVRQGMLGAFETFTDTIIVCSITALVIIITGEWSSGVSGAGLTLNAFQTVMGQGGRVLLTVCIFFLGVTTASGWYSYFEVLLRHAFGKDSKIKATVLKFYRLLYPLPGFLMVLYIVIAQKPGKEVWLFADLATGIPTFINVAVVLILMPKFLALLKDYKARYLGIGVVDPEFSVFYEDKMKKEAAKAAAKAGAQTKEKVTVSKEE